MRNGLVIVQMLVSSDPRLKHLFSRYGGPGLLMAISQYTTGLLKKEVARTLHTVTKGVTRRDKLRPRSAPARSQHGPDLWDYNQHITWSHWIKYSYDNASIMVGKNSSVLTRIRSENPAGKFEQQYHPVSNECKDERK